MAAVTYFSSTGGMVSWGDSRARCCSANAASMLPVLLQTATGGRQRHQNTHRQTYIHNHGHTDVDT